MVLHGRWILRVKCGDVSGALVDTAMFVSVYVQEPNGNPERLEWYRESFIKLLTLAQRLHIRQAKRANCTLALTLTLTLNPNPNPNP